MGDQAALGAPGGAGGVDDGGDGVGGDAEPLPVDQRVGHPAAVLDDRLDAVPVQLPDAGQVG